MFDFNVVAGTVARAIISRTQMEIVARVRETYLEHEDGNSVNPNSYFLRFPDKPSSRIIALPAYLGGEANVAGIKWISSFPANIDQGFPRASAALLLNDYETGYPFTVLEASQISAARTAASAALAAETLIEPSSARRVTVFGAGIIARNILDFLKARDWKIDEVVVHDHHEEYASALVGHTEAELGYRARVENSLTEALAGAELVVLATTAAEPYIIDEGAFANGQVVLNISLRDIGPEIIAGSYNILDDVDHCLTANTSPHLAEQKYGNRDHVHGTLAQVIRGEVKVGTDRPVIFSPFGLGVLDLAVGLHVHQVAAEQGEAIAIPGFFGETQRW